MERASQLKIAFWGMAIAAGVAIAAIVVTFGLNLWGAAERACASQTTAGAMEMAKANGCLEFWFYRYQGLVGSLIAAAVAGATLVWIARQLVAAHDQLETTRRQAASTAAGTLREVVRDYEDMRDSLWAIGKKLHEIRCYAETMQEVISDRDIRIVRLNSKSLFEVLTEAGEALQLVQTRAAEGPAYKTTGPIARQLGLLFVLDGQIQALWQKLDAAGQNVDQDGEIQAVARHLHQCLYAGAHADSVNDGVSAVFDRLVIVWKQIRRFEADAIGEHS